MEQLEALQRSKMQLEADFQAVLDEKQELITERDAYKCKLHRLNHECNILLKGNTSGIIDLDALIMENRSLQERLLQAQEETQLAKQVSERYKVCDFCLTKYLPLIRGWFFTNRACCNQKNKNKI